MHFARATSTSSRAKIQGVLLQELLPYLCQMEDFFEHAVDTSAGSLSPRTNWTQVTAYGFALRPLDELRRSAVALVAPDDNATTPATAITEIDP